MNFQHTKSIEKYQITDKITGQKNDLSDIIDEFFHRISKLESQNLELLDRIQVLEDENISTANELYRLENSLEARIDILTGEQFLKKL